MTWASMLLLLLPTTPGEACDVSILPQPRAVVLVSSDGQPKAIRLGVELSAGCVVGQVVVSHRASLTSPFQRTTTTRRGVVYECTLAYSPDLSYYLTVYPERGKVVDVAGEGGQPFLLDIANAPRVKEGDGKGSLKALGIGGAVVGGLGGLVAAASAALGGANSPPVSGDSPSVSGQWAGDLTVDGLAGKPVACVFDIEMKLDGSNENLFGLATLSSRTGCGVEGRPPSAFPLAGQVTAGGQVTFNGPSDSGVLSLLGHLAGTTMSGTFQGTLPELPGQTATGRWQAERRAPSP